MGLLWSTSLGELFAITKTRLFKYIEIFTTKIESFQIKNFDIFLISAQNIDCGYSLEPPRRGGSNECPQSMLLSRNKKNNVYPGKPQFYYIKEGLRGSKLYRHVFVMVCEISKHVSQNMLKVKSNCEGRDQLVCLYGQIRNPNMLQ